MKDDEMKRQLDLFIAAMDVDPVAADAAWKKMSTDARSLICAVVLRSLGHEVSQKRVSEAGSFDRNAFAAKAGRDDQRTANNRRRMVINHEGIERVVSRIAERAGLARPDDSDALKIRQLEERIAQLKGDVEKHERLNEVCPKYFQMMRRQQLKNAKKRNVGAPPVHGDEVVDTSFNDRLNARRSNDE